MGGIGKLKKYVYLLFASAVIISALTVNVIAAESNSFYDSGEIIGISNKGDIREYPENSLEGLLSAAQTGIDAVLADVSVTKDGIAVVIDENSAMRMLDGAQMECVSEYTLQELQSFFLRNRCGGKNNDVTDYIVPTLSELLKAADEKNIYLILRTDAENAETVIADTRQCSDVTIYLTGEQDSVKQVLSAYSDKCSIITEKRGNIVFLQTAFIDFCVENGGAGVVLKTTNRYGVNFNQTVLKHFSDKTRAVADTSDSALAGAREDTVKWWDDLISRGYSVIITNDAQGFVQYKNDNITAREKLNEALTQATQNRTLPQFTSVIFNDYKKAYTDAVSEAEELLADTSSSTRDMNDCRAAVLKACDDIDINFEAIEAGKAGLTVSVPRICLCIGAVIVVVAVQIFFFRRREKN